MHQVLTYSPNYSDDLVVVKSSVALSMRINEKPKEFWILISKSTGSCLTARSLLFPVVDFPLLILK